MEITYKYLSLFRKKNYRRGIGAYQKPQNRRKKSSKTEKPKKNSIKTACKTVKTDTFSDPSYSNPDQSDTVVTSGAYRVNYTNFITVFVNSMDLAFLFSSICLNDRLYFRSSLEDLKRGLSGGNSHRSPLQDCNFAVAKKLQLWKVPSKTPNLTFPFAI